MLEFDWQHCWLQDFTLQFLHSGISFFLLNVWIFVLLISSLFFLLSFCRRQWIHVFDSCFSWRQYAWNGSNRTETCRWDVLHWLCSISITLAQSFVSWMSCATRTISSLSSRRFGHWCNRLWTLFKLGKKLNNNNNNNNNNLFCFFFVWLRFFLNFSLFLKKIKKSNQKT